MTSQITLLSQQRVMQRKGQPLLMTSQTLATAVSGIIIQIATRYHSVTTM